MSRLQRLRYHALDDESTGPDTAATPPSVFRTGTEPQTFTFEGSHHWDTDVYNCAAPIDYTWTFTITVQRVDASGEPL